MDGWKGFGMDGIITDSFPRFRLSLELLGLGSASGSAWVLRLRLGLGRVD